MSSYVRSIGRCAVNGISFCVYENKDKTATIRPSKMSHELPRRFWLKFSSVSELDDFLESEYSNLSGAALVQALKERAFSYIFEGV